VELKERRAPQGLLLKTTCQIIYVITETLRSKTQNSQKSSLLPSFHLSQDNGATPTGFIALMIDLLIPLMKGLCIDNDDMTSCMFNKSSSVVVVVVTVTNRLIFIQLSDDEYTYSLVQAAQHTQSILVRGPVKGNDRLCRNDFRIQQFHVTYYSYRCIIFGHLSA